MASLNNINLSPAEMLAEADRMDNIHKDFEDGLSSLTNTVLLLNQVWSDNAQTAFYEKYESVLKKYMETILEELEIYTKAVRQHANDMQSTVDTSVSRINKL